LAVKVKICGITNPEDATWAVNLGADFLGLNFHSGSPRKVSPDQAAKVVQKVPPFVPCIGVFVNQSVDEIVKTVEKTGLMGVQLHGEYSPEDCQALRDRLEGSVPVIRVFRVKEDGDLDPLVLFRNAATHFLLDAKVEAPLPEAAPGETSSAPVGGTGQTFPWELVERAKGQGLPVFVAGGLTPDNVREAVKKTQPFGVDVASGVERSPKRKDYDKLKIFIEQAKKG
jgi:phosphoribosylanthranilate isomerase